MDVGGLSYTTADGERTGGLQADVWATPESWVGGGPSPSLGASPWPPVQGLGSLLSRGRITGAAALWKRFLSLPHHEFCVSLTVPF